jgi:hypothetical protein
MQDLGQITEVYYLIISGVRKYPGTSTIKTFLQDQTVGAAGGPPTRSQHDSKALIMFIQVLSEEANHVMDA